MHDCTNVNLIQWDASLNKTVSHPTWQQNTLFPQTVGAAY